MAVIPYLERSFLLAKLLPVDKISDENIEIIGADIFELEKGSTHTIGIVIDFGETNLPQDIER
ncbi:MAG: hypothetical protein ACFFAS_06605 [Promethearchaeota archaeon]